MRVRFLRDHGVYRAGTECDHPAPGVAAELVRRGVAEAVRPDPPRPTPVQAPERPPQPERKKK